MENEAVTMQGISAKVIADSINAYTGTRITTFELDYPRFIHSEFMTHRMFSRNAQSSRAVPVSSTMEVNKEWVKPVVWGKNKAGMSSVEELTGIDLMNVQSEWDDLALSAFEGSKFLADSGLHKQWANRVTEPFSRIKVICTATEYDNFYWLRIDPDAAQPEMVKLGTVMFEAKENSIPVILTNNQWHVPYIKQEFINNKQVFYDSNGEVLYTEQALKISASCCAQVSYRKLNDTKEKALEIYDRLFSGPKPHLSPVEHQARVAHGSFDIAGFTHMDRAGNYWSGNLKNFVQYRQLLST